MSKVTFFGKSKNSQDSGVSKTERIFTRLLCGILLVPVLIAVAAVVLLVAVVVFFLSFIAPILCLIVGVDIKGKHY